MSHQAEFTNRQYIAVDQAAVTQIAIGVCALK